MNLKTLPLFARTFIFDFATTAVVTELALQFSGDSMSFLHATAVGLGAAAVAAAAKNVPGFKKFLAEELAVDPNAAA